MGETVTEELKGTTILTEKEKEVPLKETQLFKSEEEKVTALAAAKEAALKELEAKAAADKAVAEKAAQEAAAAKKAEEEKAKAKEKEVTPPKKEATPSSTDYTLNLPENSALTPEDLAATLEEAKKAGLTEEQAKNRLQTNDQLAKTAQSRLVQKQEQDMKAMVETWKESVRNDAEMGGEKMAETAIKASRAFKAVASPAMQIFCEKTGYADHPEMVRMMLKVYDLIGEDKFIRGSTGALNATPTTMEEKAKKLFGNPIKEAAV